MNWVVGFFLGFMVCFIFGRIGDNTCKDAGAACEYDCALCTCHCVGFHCAVMRNEIARKRDENQIPDDYLPDEES